MLRPASPSCVPLLLKVGSCDVDSIHGGQEPRGSSRCDLVHWPIGWTRTATAYAYGTTALPFRALEPVVETDRESAERYERERKEEHDRHERERKSEHERASRERLAEHERHAREQEEE